jgi:hypothetical protein
VIFLGATVKLNHLESKSLDMRQTRILLAGKEDERNGGLLFPSVFNRNESPKSLISARRHSTFRMGFLKGNDKTKFIEQDCGCREVWIDSACATCHRGC